ncbi:hypothetical protein G6514_005644 [Epicoccum nigrum]|nr:hypothetical protein G6514_005644 [Epicoccum nigrum]
MAGRLIAYCKIWIGIYPDPILAVDTSDTDSSTKSTRATDDSPDGEAATDVKPDDNSTATTADNNDDDDAKFKQENYDIASGSELNTTDQRDDTTTAATAAFALTQDDIDAKAERVRLNIASGIEPNTADVAIIGAWYFAKIMKPKAEKVRLEAAIVRGSRMQEQSELHAELSSLHEKVSKQHAELTKQNWELERIARNNPAEGEMVLLLLHLSYACVDISGSKKIDVERRMRELLATMKAEHRAEVKGFGQDAEAGTKAGGQADSQESK